MIDKLRAEFPSLVVEESLPLNDDLEYFRLQTGEYIGIKKSELDSKNRGLLSIFLTPIHYVHNVSPLQTLWQEALLSKSPISINTLINQYDQSVILRFIHFYLQSEVDRSSFEEALSFLSLSRYTVLWVNSTSGVIIEEKQQNSITKEEILDWRNAITSDFYTDVYLFIGDYFKIDRELSQHYEFEVSCFQLTRQFKGSQAVFQSHEIIPYLLLQDASSNTRKNIERSILESTDEELHTLKTFIECGLNISLAAKNLFLHRNSLQYKVDKFIEKTGIDIKSFKGALVVYLAILSRRI